MPINAVVADITGRIANHKIVRHIRLQQVAEEFYPLDSAAKMYPLSMTSVKMAIFRLSANMTSTVDPALLQQSLDTVIKRFPIFATTLKCGLFWHYLNASRKRVAVEMESELPCAPIKLNSTKDQVFRLLYYNNRISLEVFHCVSDGTGAMAFMSSILREYLRLSGVELTPDKYTIDLSEEPSAEETLDAFPMTDDVEQTVGFGSGRALHLDGKRTKWQPAQLLHFVMPSDKLAAIAKEHGTTIGGLILSSMFAAANASHNKKGKGRSLKIQVPVDMRRYYPVGTLRNFSMYAIVSIPPETAANMQLLIPTVDKQLREKTSKESVDAMAMMTKNLMGNRFLRYTPIAIKKVIISVIVNRIREKSFTAVLSNIGKIPTDYQDNIKYFEAIPGPSGIRQVGCGLISYKDTTVLTITKPTLDNRFESSLHRILTQWGMNITVEGNNP